MLEELGKLADKGRLRNFTDLADAVMRVDQTIGQVDDKQALYRVARLLDSVFGQAYRGEKSMAFLAERVNSVAEVLDLMAMEDTGGMEGMEDMPKTPGAETTTDPAAEPTEPEVSAGEDDPKADPQPDAKSPFKWGVMWPGSNTPAK